MAAIFVPGSLPPLVLTLTILHELGHLAAGDLLIEPDEQADEDTRDSEETTFETLPLKKGRSSHEDARSPGNRLGSAKPI